MSKTISVKANFNNSSRQRLYGEKIDVLFMRKEGLFIILMWIFHRTRRCLCIIERQGQQWLQSCQQKSNITNDIYGCLGERQIDLVLKN